MTNRLRLAALVALMLSACAPSNPQPPVAPPTQPPATPATDATAPQAPPGYEGKAWADVLAEARGQTVDFYMWGGSDVINRWVTGPVADLVKSEYDVTLNLVPVSDAPEFINKVLNEKQAGRSDGSVDLMWVNGENFRTLREGELAYGPWAQFLPNAVYVNQDDPSVANDFGYPVDGYESPYGKAQFVMIYDSARTPEPPRTMAALLEWIAANPGRFAYAAPPDFTGSAFVRHVCYHVAGGYERLLGAFDAAVFDQHVEPCFGALQALEPSLWRGGQTYPESRAQMQDLFANGEIDFDMAYNPAEASSLIAQGRYPATTRTYVFDEGTIANTHYVAISFNATDRAGAMVVANALLSPELQLSKADPEGWGDLTVLDPALLPADWAARFKDLPRGPATLSDAELASRRLPELQAAWLSAIEAGWIEQVLER
ncbi:MAG TPA: ABC transporter substrate-binding protein [Anaerolineales bacterium]|nr:ABC transporter substrate-binding protein [Anaerolineales bacterium]